MNIALISQDYPEHMSPNLAARVAFAMEQEIVDSGWSVGQQLGLEDDLAKRYGVGRWVMREALAITQRDGLTQMRRGRNGGVYISAPPADVVATTMRNFLLFARTSSDELLMLKRVLDGIACTLAVGSNDPVAFEQSLQLFKQLKSDKNLGHLRPSFEIYRQILRLSNNRIVQIFGETLSQLAYGVGICVGSSDFSREEISGNTQRLWFNRLYQLERVLAGDLNGALQAAGTAHDGILDLYADSPYRGKQFYLGDSFAHTQALAERIVEAFPSEASGRRQESLGLQIQLDILRLDYPVGAPMGSENTLMEIYSVGRNVLRETVRALERDHIVAAAEGRNGGLCVANPTPINIVRTCVLFLRFMRVTDKEIEPVAKALLGVAAETVAKHIGERGGVMPSELLDYFSEGWKSQSGRGANFLAVLLRTMTEATGSPILQVFGQTLAELSLQNAEMAQSMVRKSAPRRAEALALLRRTLIDGDAIGSRRVINHL